jgi:UDP:flavonoid glycosyltransferase YjiC (YdhE family)
METETKMKILLLSIGTRGDMEPFLAIGEILKEKGHRVVCAFPGQFKDLALKHGCATMAIPHIIDQFVWNSIISGLGAGPGGIKIDRIREKNLEPKILDLYNNRDYKQKAEEIIRQKAGEDLKEKMYDLIIR